MVGLQTTNYVLGMNSYPPDSYKAWSYQQGKYNYLGGSYKNGDDQNFKAFIFGYYTDQACGEYPSIESTDMGVELFSMNSIDNLPLNSFIEIYTSYVGLATVDYNGKYID